MEGEASEATALHRRYPNEIRKKILVMELHVQGKLEPILKQRSLLLAVQGEGMAACV